MKRSAVTLAITCCVVLTACQDENEWPTARIDSPGQDTTIAWPYGTVDFRGTASDVDGVVVTHDWGFDFGRGANVEDPGEYTYGNWGVDTVIYQVFDDDGALSNTAKVVVTVLGLPADPAPGDWSGVAEFGELVFTLDDPADAVTSVGFGFDGWQCGTVTRNATVTAENPIGWPITGSGFSLDTTFGAIGLTMAVEGSFGADHVASGSWTGVSGGATCSGTWRARSDSVSPALSVRVHPDFSTKAVLGYDWLPGGHVTLEIDNGADGTVDYQQTTTVGDNGDARFQEGHLPPPFTVAEGDSVKLTGDKLQVRYKVLYLTLTSVDAAMDLVSGRARAGTGVEVNVFDPALPFPGAHAVRLVVDATGMWTADFSQVFDIVADSRGVVSAYCIPGICTNAGTGIDWNWP